MSIEQIHKEAEYRYPIRKGCCRLERQKLKYLKQRFIDKKMEEFGFVVGSGFAANNNIISLDRSQNP